MVMGAVSGERIVGHACLPPARRAPHTSGERLMPEISRFLGIIITMYYDDHAPPHFHVRYAGDQARLEIGSLLLLSGSLSPRVRALVTEWAAEHEGELRRDWDLARAQQPLQPIPPLA